MFFSVFFIADVFLPRKEGIKGMKELGCDTLPLLSLQGRGEKIGGNECFSLREFEI